jgi:type III secretion system FlhB-like substrate exporter
MFKSNIEIREFAINKAVELMGTGTPTKQVVDKAKEIETYIKGEAELPEVLDEEKMVNTIIEALTGVAIGLLNQGCSPTTVIEKAE